MLPESSSLSSLIMATLNSARPWPGMISMGWVVSRAGAMKAPIWLRARLTVSRCAGRGSRARAKTAWDSPGAPGPLGGASLMAAATGAMETSGIGSGVCAQAGGMANARARAHADKQAGNKEGGAEGRGRGEARRGGGGCRAHAARRAGTSRPRQEREAPPAAMDSRGVRPSATLVAVFKSPPERPSGELCRPQPPSPSVFFVIYLLFTGET